MAQIIIGIVLIVVLVIALFVIMTISDEDGFFGLGVLWTIGIVIGITLIIVGAQTEVPAEYNSSEYSVNTRITTTVVNGCATKHDTTYIFTPVKK